MRKALRELRKEHVKPVSKMKKADISAELERLKGRLETHPSIAQDTDVPKKMKPSTESIKEAKRHEFPAEPEHIVKEKHHKKEHHKKEHHKKEHHKGKEEKESMKAKMMKMLAEMED